MKTFQILKHVVHVVITALWRVRSDKIKDLCHTSGCTIRSWQGTGEWRWI